MHRMKKRINQTFQAVRKPPKRRKKKEVIFINPNIIEAGKSTRFNSETARIAGRKGGKAKAEKEKRLADFGEAMTYFLTNGGIVIDGNQYDNVSAICLRLIQKVIEDGDVSAFRAIVEIIDKHNDKNSENDDDNVLAFIEAMRHNGE